MKIGRLRLFELAERVGVGGEQVGVGGDNQEVGLRSLARDGVVSAKLAALTLFATTRGGYRAALAVALSCIAVGTHDEPPSGGGKTRCTERRSGVPRSNTNHSGEQI